MRKPFRYKPPLRIQPPKVRGQKRTVIDCMRPYPVRQRSDLDEFIPKQALITPLDERMVAFGLVCKRGTMHLLIDQAAAQEIGEALLQAARRSYENYYDLIEIEPE